jgi:3',5'-cyclic AMP phosphodiesterase CpdA
VIEKTKNYMPKFIHLSDLHFSKVSLNPFQFVSKRWIGNFNLFLFRKKEISEILAHQFIEQLDTLKPDVILISGDFTSTALKKEFDFAKNFIGKIKQKGIKVFGLPGNHDAYTKKAFKRKLFYQHFKGLLPFKGEFEFDLETHKVAAFCLDPDHYLVLIDASCYTPYFQSNGILSFQIEQHLQALLEMIPPSGKIWMGCHYPFFEHENERRILIGAKNLKKIIERFTQIEVFFHGHTHRQAIADLRVNDLPIISDSGSLTYIKKSSFNYLTYDDDILVISKYHHEQKFIPEETLNLIRKK